jgi:hypothetical protein
MQNVESPEPYTPYPYAHEAQTPGKTLHDRYLQTKQSQKSKRLEMEEHQ